MNKINQIFLLIFLLSALVACDNAKPSHGTNLSETRNTEDMGPISILKDADGNVVAEGAAVDGIRQGEWKFYVSPEARESRVPDVVGSYNNEGKKTGVWTHTNAFTKVGVNANFDDGVMQGECIYFDNSDNSILARGLVSNGIRHGKWVFYDQHNEATGGYYKNGLKLNEKMSEGYYKDGVRIGKWEYDYFLDKNTHVKGHLSFENGTNTGRIEFYKVETHDKFGTDELLAGVGEYKNGRKVGRWVEYNYGTKGDFIETGDYNEKGQRDGYWKVVIGDQTYNTSNFVNGTADGPFKKYYPNGNIRHEGVFDMGLEAGEFKNYYKSGQVKEQGTYVLTDDDVTRDTIFYQMRMPYEYHFQLVEEDFADMHYDYISWLDQPGWSIEPSELKSRYEEFKTYGKEDSRRIADIKVHDKRSVRKGTYLSFYENGKLHEKGENIPKIITVFDPVKRQMLKTYGRDGDWKVYDKKGLLKHTLVYKAGKLEKMLDGNGYIAHQFTYRNGKVNMDGKDISLNLNNE